MTDRDPVEEGPSPNEGRGRRREKDPLGRHIRTGLWLLILTGAGSVAISTAFFFKVRSEVPPSNTTQALSVAVNWAGSLTGAAYGIASVSVVASLTMILLTATSMQPDLILERIRRRTFHLQLLLSLFPLGLAAFGILLASATQAELITPYQSTPSVSASGLAQADLVLFALILWQGLYLVVLAWMATLIVLSRSTAVSRSGARMLENLGETKERGRVK